MGIFKNNVNFYQKITALLAVVGSFFVLLMITRASYNEEILLSMTGVISSRIFVILNVLRVLLLWLVSLAVIKQYTSTRLLLTVAFFIEAVSVFTHLFVLDLPKNPVWIVGTIGPLFVVTLTYFLWIKCMLWGKDHVQVNTRSYDAEYDESEIVESGTLRKLYDPVEMQKNQEKLNHPKVNVTPYKSTVPQQEYKEPSKKIKSVLVLTILLTFSYLIFENSELIKAEIKNFLGASGLIVPTKGKKSKRLVKRFKVKSNNSIKNAVYIEPQKRRTSESKLSQKFSNRVHSKRVLKKKTTYYELGHAYLARKQYTKAIDAFKRYLKTKGAKYTKMLSHYFLATIYEKHMNDNKSALKHWLILKRMPSHKVKYQINFPKRAVDEVNRLQRRPKVL